MKINKGQFRLNSKQKLLEFELKRGKGHLLDYINNRIKWHLNPRLHKVPKFPSHVDIELSSLCNLNCPMCYTTTEEFKEKVDQQTMSFELFKKIIDECSKYNLFSIRLSFRGEAFLHPNIIPLNTDQFIDKKKYEFLNYENHSPENFSTCLSPWTSIHVNNDGNVIPCMAISLGNVKTQSLEEIYFSKISESFKGEIKKCGTLPGCNRCGWLKFKNN